MYKSVKRISFLRGVVNDGTFFSPCALSYFQIFRNGSGLKVQKAAAEGAETQKEVAEEISYNGFLQQRQEQATRSIIVQIPEFRSLESFVHMCSSFGDINKVIHYTVDQNNFLLLEMKTEEELQNLLTFTKNQTKEHNSQICDHFYVFSNETYGNTPELPKTISNTISLKVPIKKNYHDFFYKLQNIKKPTSSQLLKLYQYLKIDDLGMRLRFLTCRQIQLLFSGLLPNSKVYPFGSSVSGFGISGSDLDLVVMPETHNNGSVFQIDRNFLNIERSLLQTHITLSYNLINHFLKGCKNVVCIKNARVPIVKFKQHFTGLECDLSLYNPHGVSVSQILFRLSSMNDCVKPLVFAIKIWAKRMKIVPVAPGKSFSNFSIMLLVIFALQQNFILPPWDVFHFEDDFLLTENISQSFTDNTKQTSDDTSLEKLLLFFFKFYADFEFFSKGISLRTGKVVKKPYNDPLYIENPLLPNLNVSQNVSLGHLNAFQNNCVSATKLMKKGKKFNEILDFPTTNHSLDVDVSDIFKT